MTTIGRGRGRGRAALIAKLHEEQKPGPPAPVPKVENEIKQSSPTTQSQQVSNPSPKKETAAESFKAVIAENAKLDKPTDPNAKSIAEITKGIELLTCSEVLKKVPAEMMRHNNEKPFEELCTQICDKALKDPDFATTAAKLCNQLWVDESMHQFIRSPLLTIVQRKYSKRNELKKESRDKLYGLCVFLCELYKLLRLRSQPLKPLTAHVVQILKELLESESPSADDALYFYQELESVGSTVEMSDKEKMDDLIKETRLLVISSNVTASVRCRLIQVLELRAANWKMSEEVCIAYEDMLQELLSEGR